MQRSQSSWRGTIARLFTPRALAAAWCLFGLSAAGTAKAGVYITEFNSTSNVGNFEFVEFTNTGATPVDMTGWSEDDSNRTSNKSSHSLSGFGTLQPGESAIFTEATPDAMPSRSIRRRISRAVARPRSPTSRATPRASTVS